MSERTRELREAQEELIRNEGLATLGRVAEAIAHELNNPMGVISNAVYYLRMTQPDADQKTREYFDLISFQVGTATEIITGLLDFTREVIVQRGRVSVSRLIQEVLKIRPAPHNVTMSVKVPSDLPSLFVDNRHMSHVLLNLMSNVYQAMPEGGELTISAQKENERVRIAVADTGCGISPENLESIFEPLFTTKARGIGLGLAISRNLVEVNGGTIEVKSEAGEGSTFTVILPTE